MLTKVRLNDLPEWLEGESPKLFECIKKDYQLHQDDWNFFWAKDKRALLPGLLKSMRDTWNTCWILI